MILDTVVLPQPLSPTRPNDSPRLIGEGDVVDGDDLPRLTAEPAAFARVEGLAQARDLEQHRRGLTVGARRERVLTVAQQRAPRRRHFADRRQTLAGRHVQARHGVQERLEIGVTRRGQQIGAAAALHHPAVIQHHDLVGHVGDDAEIVRDEQDRHAELGLELLHELQDLRLDRDVERGRRLVGDQQGRPAHQRHRDHRALAQSARQLERIGPEGALGVWEADPT